LCLKKVEKSIFRTHHKYFRKPLNHVEIENAIEEAINGKQ